MVLGVFALEKTSLKSSGLTPRRFAIFSKLDESTDSPDSVKELCYVLVPKLYKPVATNQDTLPRIQGWL